MVTARKKEIREINSTYINEQEHHEDIRARKRRGLVRRLATLSIFIALLVTFTMVTMHSQASIIEEKEQKKLVLEDKLLVLKLDERDLREDINNYNDLEYIAEIARRDYFLSKPGETIFKLPPSSLD